MADVDEFAGAEVVEIVELALEETGHRCPVERWQWVQHGSANTVVLAGGVAVRVSRSTVLAAESLRAQRLVDQLPTLPFEVPRSLGEPVRTAGLVAVVQLRLHGEAHPVGTGDPAALRILVDAIRSLPPAQLSPHLATPRSFMGRENWYEVATGVAIPMLAKDVQKEARRRIDALHELGLPAHPTIVHGDLAGANLLWAGGRVASVLDWDLASYDDPAEDVASLAAWHGWDAVSECGDSALLGRARLFAATHPIQVICFAYLHGRTRADLARVATRANQRLRP